MIEVHSGKISKVKPTNQKKGDNCFNKEFIFFNTSKTQIFKN